MQAVFRPRGIVPDGGGDGDDPHHRERDLAAALPPVTVGREVGLSGAERSQPPGALHHPAH
eukprot:2003632-Pyramimonas_sp.AAC.1